MPARVAINGYGRIGQCLLRALYENGYRDQLQVVAINELSDPETIAHLTRFDTTHGRFAGQVDVSGEGLVVDGDPVRIVREADAEKLPWSEIGVDLVLDCTGLGATRAQGQKHLDAGAGRVLFSQPGDPDLDATLVYGVNHTTLGASDRIVSNASCTTNCIVPVIQALDAAYGIEQGATTTIHSAMNDQPVIDAYHHQDLRRTRSAFHNMVPVDTGLARGIERLLPSMAGRFSSVAVRVPTINVSAIDMTVSVRSEADTDSVNAVLKETAASSLDGIIGYTEELLASTDFNHDARSGVVDAGQTRVSGGRMVKVLCWFDNEWGYANRMLDVARYWASL
ncbi:erythrose-4-phosphate dehydrogenase [Halovibrio salipaludis]|uniref:Erythrose-4-phosphate dehydrogenase n=1 Tax=Halovibrio salipaludis TaxID=2032626 RepID=A0A2A2EZ69_9GAMM|nr:glyceraldehyde 3-phosphate dehydrogenase NAD-binding domain-containing protein [Halovibrio salipaludis]PAU77840.1 erythrose-4-phosphate dehydrogenase [Halovibrio salipaludis]